MTSTTIIGVILVAAVLWKELSYLSFDMILTRKSIGEYLIFGCGIAVLVGIMVRFASGWFQILFGILGIIMFFVMWFKQGISSKGVLTIARGKELISWEEIDYARTEENGTISWYRENGAMILKQKYSKDRIQTICERIADHKIPIK